MKNIFFFLLLWSITGISCQEGTASRSGTKSPEGRITVGVFDGHGGAQSCIWETVAAVRLDPEMDVRTITTADIARNVLDSLDALIIPGGGGSRQYLNLGAENQKRIKDFIAGGKGAVGICAGAYLFSSTPAYACMGLNGAKAIDIEHDNRGHGMAKFTLNEKGKEVFPELAQADTCFVIYYEGPVFVENEEDSVKYTLLATMESDVHEEGNAPENMTNGKPFFITSRYGRGRIFSSIAHPEATPGMMWMIPRMVRWSLNKPLISYKKEVIRPDLSQGELLMSLSDLQKETAFFQTLLHQKSEQKIEALDWLQAHHSWDAKRWIQGLLYDGSPAVRLRAARYIADTQYLPYLPDLRAAYLAEKDPQTKAGLKEQLDRLEILLP